MRILTVLAILGVAIAPAAADDSWPQFRGPNGDGHADAKSLPSEWSESKNVRWKVEIHDKGWASPVIWGDQIWMTTAKADGSTIKTSVFTDASGGVYLGQAAH